MMQGMARPAINAGRPGGARGEAGTDETEAGNPGGGSDVLGGATLKGRPREVSMGREPGDTAVERLLAERGQDLMRAAVALAGTRADGEDLLQAALERLLKNWRRVDTDLEAYLRRTLYNLAADGWRRRGRWRGRLAEFRSQARAAGTGSEDVAAVDLRDALVRL